MKILHTSDWHIGRTFHGVDLRADQEAALTAIAQIVEREKVDVVVMAGDLYDRSMPSAEAVRVCNEAFVAIRQAGAELVVISGNHDSPARVGAGAEFSSAGGLHLFTDIDRIDQPLVRTDVHGEVRFYGIPYLEPEVVRRAMGIPEARSHTDVVRAAMSRVRADLASAPAGTRAVVAAHAFVVGGEATGSERSISVGGVETVSAEEFSGVDYVALGHLHSPQEISAEVRYSGSPLPYSFGERSHRKAVWLVELGADGLGAVTRVDLPEVRGLSRLTGELETLLTDPAWEEAEDHYVSAVLTDTVRPLDAMSRLQSRFPHAVHVEWQRPGGDDALHYRERVRGKDDREVFTSFLDDVYRGPTAEQDELITAALSAARVVEG